MQLAKHINRASRKTPFCLLLLWIIVLWLLPDVQGYEPREYRWSLICEPASSQNRRIAPVFLAPGMDVSSFWVRILSDLKVTCFLFELRHS